MKAGIYEPVNLSALLNLEILTKGKIRPVDCSYIFLLKDVVAVSRAKAREDILKASQGKHVIIGWIRPWDFKSFFVAALSSGIELKPIASFPEEEPIFVLAHAKKTDTLY